MKIFFDTEFTGLHQDATLISIGMVAENGKKFYAEFLDYEPKQCSEWIKENVISKLFLKTLPYQNDETILDKWKAEGYEINAMPFMPPLMLMQFCWAKEEKEVRYVKGDSVHIGFQIEKWLSQFDTIQFVSDVCHYDFVLLINIFGTAFDLPKNVSASCHDINQDIARYYGISEKEAFDKSREEIVAQLCKKPIVGIKHNSLYDAEIIKAIYEEVV